MATSTIRSPLLMGCPRPAGSVSADRARRSARYRTDSSVRTTSCRTPLLGSPRAGRLWGPPSCSPWGPSRPEEVELRRYEVMLILPAEADESVVSGALDRIRRIISEAGGDGRQRRPVGPQAVRVRDRSAERGVLRRGGVHGGARGRSWSSSARCTWRTRSCGSRSSSAARPRRRTTNFPLPGTAIRRGADRDGRW